MRPNATGASGVVATLGRRLDGVLVLVVVVLQLLRLRLEDAQRLSTAAMRALIQDLCGWHPLRGEELAGFLGKDLKYLRNKHLSALIQAGDLVFL